MTDSKPLNSDLIDKLYWVRKFRMAKNEQTLAFMVSKVTDNYHSHTAIMAAIYLAECQRERELAQGRLLEH